MLQDRRGLGLGLGVGLSSFPGGIQPFIMSVKTDNTSAGSTTATQFKLPLPSSGTYNFSVDWGDGSSNTITAYNQAQTTHTYSTAGTNTVKILGVCIGWQFLNTGDRLKLLDVMQYGCLTLNDQYAFWGCANLTGTAIDSPKITSTSMISCFAGCTNFNGNVGSWNMSNVTNIDSMFYNCTAFNNGGSSSIGNWTFSGLSTVSVIRTFEFCPAFNQPVNWNIKVSDARETFYQCTVFNQNLGNWDMSQCAQTPYMLAYCPAFNNGGSSSIASWNTGNATDMSALFVGCTSFNQNISSWNVSKNRSFDAMFSNCTSFNQPIGAWNTSAGTTFYQTFNGCTLFNQNLGNWNMFKATVLSGMFSGCTNFNNGGSPDINNWTFNGLTNINVSYMFANCPAFNQPINWVIKTSNAQQTFFSSPLFNQNVGNWNMSSCTTMLAMFNGATAFNNGGSPDINNWDTGNAIEMRGVFQSCTNFNQPVGNWNTSNTQGMIALFYNCTSFNQNIGAWNVTNVQSFESTFYGCTAFNNGGSSTINNWTLNTTVALYMATMFYNCTSFTQPINNWNISKAYGLNNFMTGKSSANYSTANYDAILNSWSLLTLTPNQVLGMGTIKYTAAGAAGRATLTSAPKNWTVIDGGI
jgi:surface protein